MLDVTVANFETEVIEASMTTPVLVDFWAPWCGPCKSLGPILEKLELEYAGRFKLAKINSDDEQQLAGAFGIRSIPTCVLMMGGKPVDGFQGAMPESQVKAFLDKHVPSADQALAAAEDEEALDDLAAGDTASALDKLADAVAKDPDNHNARYDYVKLLMQSGLVAEAAAAFEPVKLLAETEQRFRSLAWWQEAVHVGAQTDVAALGAAIEANKRDFAARYALAQAHVAAHAFTDAMDELLEILMRDKTWDDEAARKAFVAVLDIITPPTPKVEQGKVPPEDPVVVKYRRRLSSVVLS
jgi:putative thioredoxin